jgi:hypothetical protein
VTESRKRREQPELVMWRAKQPSDFDTRTRSQIRLLHAQPPCTIRIMRYNPEKTLTVRCLEIVVLDQKCGLRHVA